ncbi:organic cation transporter protein [Scaptodrosophila lebanonensis]|uniref:Organic cation transporter protein n=1 Tax=Drosophila lebanonensis TaxID=7225 RepID=A0A6J2TEV4_DROLE|nr:organic cation transporter protein [Scaptodrosophila lebanonensis]XP_030373516.1 organic cation transporter protein [Scaptodrosophila lebanonensis]XP_030373517.1 organic cation transporter protein [Scaptodrosophila lebanonensis]XP_030373518.1 organic cation transporter protein [Scaptodrosophila lebanonensis]XP_030373519.1 organic cation transporter protein [Scaptodrosophila lebanonensis]XP_030373521.1 organic cation transporter protein [Scaptodrosophila lebanonensis]
MDFDQILAKCGDFHRYQFMILALFGFINIIVSMHYFTQTVISFVPDHWCYHEKLVNMTYKEIAEIYTNPNITNPSCTRLDDIIGHNVTVSNKTCEKWIYNYDFGYRSMNTELNWVCDSAYKARVGQSLFFIGSVVGTLFYGLLSDKIGRVPALILSNFCGFAGDFSTIFTKSVATFTLCRFISGLAADTNFYLMYIIVLEYIRPSMRTLGLNMAVGLFYCMGLVVTPWLAVWAGHWKIYLACTSLPILLVTLYYFVVQESAQWLVTRNDIDGAIKRLKRVAKFNGCRVTQAEFDEFRRHCQITREMQGGDDKKHATLLDMFRTPRMRKNTLILFFKSMVITLCYDAVSRNVEGMGISPFVMFSLSALAVLPSSILLVLLQDRIGRKGMASGSLLVGGLFTAAAGIAIAYQQHNHNAILLACLTIAARFGVAISYESGSQYATELIPTCVRGQGVAAVHVAGFAASFLAPYILWLGTFFKAAPSIILGVLFFAGSFVCLLLPETLNRTLPTTIEEGEVFGKGERMFDFPCLKHHDDDDDDDDSELEKYKRKHSLIDAKQQVESGQYNKRKQSLIDADREEQALKDAKH